MSTQTLKAALESRVNTAQASRLASESRHLGNGMMCPAGAGDIAFDIYGRPATQNTLPVNTDSACSNYTQWSSERIMAAEGYARPYISICASGLRGQSDFMGYSRDLMPQNLYGTGERGNFVRHYPSPNNAPPQEPRSEGQFYSQNLIQPATLSHDATSGHWAS